MHKTLRATLFVLVAAAVGLALMGAAACGAQGGPGVSGVAASQGGPGI
jgi:hypothetical protein